MKRDMAHLFDGDINSYTGLLQIGSSIRLEEWYQVNCSTKIKVLKVNLPDPVAPPPPSPVLTS